MIPSQDPYRRAQQEQAAAEAAVASQQREAERLATAQAKQAAKEQEAAAKAARKAELSRQELDMRAQGMIPVTTADGALHPDPLFEQKQAEKAAKEKRDAEAAQLSDRYTREGRKFFTSKVTGLPVALESDAQLEQQRRDRAEKARRDALDERIRATETAATDPAKRRLPQKARDKKLEEIKTVIQQEALPALQSTLTERSKAVSGGADWIPFNEAATEDAQKAQQHLQRLQSLDPSNPDLTDEDLAILESNDATKPHVQKLRNIQSLLAKDDEAAKFHEQTANSIFDLKLRRDNPAAWAERQRQRRASLPPDQLAADLEATHADLTARGQALDEAVQPILARRAATQQKLDSLTQQAAQRRQQGLTAGEMVTMTKPDGTTETWPSDLAAAWEKEIADGQYAEAQDAPLLERLAAQHADLQTEAALLSEGSTRLNEVTKANQAQQATSARRRFQFTPGMEQTGKELDALASEAQTRQQVLAEMHPDGIPQEALDALNADIQAKTDTLITAGEAKLQGAAQAAAQIRQRLDAREFEGKDASPAYAEAAAQLAQQTGTSPEEAQRLITDAESATDWTNAYGRHNEGDTPGQTRLLSNGGIVVNPSITDKAAYEKAVAASGGTPDAQADAIARYPQVREAAARQVLESIQEIASVFGPGAVADYTAYAAKRPGDVSEAEWAMRYVENENANARSTTWNTLKSITREAWASLNQGAIDLRQQASGLLGGLTGSETLIQDAQWAGRKADALQQAKVLSGDQSTNVAASAAFSSIPRLAASILPAAKGAQAVTGGVRLFAGTALGARLMPSLAAAIEGAATPAQAAKAVDTLTRAGLGGAAAAGAAQTYGAQIADIYGTLRRENPELSHADALQQAQAPAVVSALATAALTTLGGSSGVERLFTRPQEARAVFDKVFASRLQQAGFIGKEFLKGGLKESFLEELPDEMISQIAAAVGTGKPVQQALAEFLQQLPELALATTALGGAGQGIAAARESSVSPAQTAPAAPQSSIPPEVIASAESAIDGLQIPEVDEATLARTQDAARGVLYIAQGTPLTELDADTLAALDIVEDPHKPGTFVNGRIVPGKNGVPELQTFDAGQAPVANADGTAGMRPVRVRMIDGQPVISQPTLDKLSTLLPAVRAAIPLDEKQRLQQLQQPAQNTAARSQQSQQSGSSPAPVESGPNASQSTVQAPANLGNESPRSGSSPAPSGDAVTQRATELATLLESRGLTAPQALHAARKVVEAQGVVGASAEEQYAAGIDDELYKVGWIKPQTRKKYEFFGRGTPPTSDAPTPTLQNSTTPASESDPFAVTKAPSNPVTSPASTGDLADRVVVAKQRAMKTVPVASRKRFVKFVSPLTTHLARFQKAFPGGVVFTDAKGQNDLSYTGAGIVVADASTNPRLEVNLAELFQSAAHLEEKDLAAFTRRAVMHEVRHLAALKVITTGQARALWKDLTPALQARVYASYYAVDLQNATGGKPLSQKQLLTLAQQAVTGVTPVNNITLPKADPFHMAHEFLRMLDEDAEFAGQTSEAMDASPSLGQAILDFLRSVLDEIKRLIATDLDQSTRVQLREFQKLVEAARKQILADNPADRLGSTKEAAAAPLTTAADNRASVLSSSPSLPVSKSEFNPVRGSTGTAYTDSNDAIEYQWAVADVNSLTISNLDNGRINPDYPQELQPRDRTSAASEAQVNDIAKNFNLDRLSASSSVGDGAPIVGPDTVVESGNGRVMGARRAHTTGKPSAEAYKKALVARAAEFGLNAEQVEAVPNPVLIRIRTTEVNRTAFVLAANVSTIAPKREMEQAKIDAKQIVPDLFDSFVPAEDGEIFTAANADFIRGFVAAVIPPAERGQVIDASGNLSQSGLRRIRNALFVHAYGTSPEALNALGRLTESIEASDTALARALLAMAPRFAEQNARIAAGALYPFGITENLAQALQKLADLRARGEKVETWLAQDRIPGIGDDPGPVTTALVQFLHDNRQRPRQILAALDRYAKALDGAGDPRQISLFGDEKPDAITLWNLAANYKEPALAMGSKRVEAPAEKVDFNPDMLAAKIDQDRFIGPNWYYSTLKKLRKALAMGQPVSIENREVSDYGGTLGVIIDGEKMPLTRRKVPHRDMHFHFGVQRRQKVEPTSTSPSLPVSSSPSLPPSAALKLYRKLTAQQADKPLTPPQSQALERAERSLGQLFLFDEPNRTLKPAEDLVLEQQTASRATFADSSPEQLKLFMASKTTDPRLMEKFGAAWPHGWDANGFPNMPRVLPDGDPRLEPTLNKKTALLQPDHPLVLAGLLPAGREFPRKALHQKIVEFFMRDAVPLPEGTQPTLYAMGGGGGAGKSTILNILKRKGGIDTANAVHINADDIKELIPEYHDLKQAGDGRAAATVHEESSRLSNNLMDRAIPPGGRGRYNVVFDGTLSNGPKSLKLIARWRAAGLRVHLIAVTIDPREAVTRAVMRGADSGRWVPGSVLAQAHAELNAAVKSYLPEVDAADLYDNTPPEPHQIAQKTAREQEISIVNQEYWSIIDRRSHEALAPHLSTGHQAGAGSTAGRGQTPLREVQPGRQESGSPSQGTPPESPPLDPRLAMAGKSVRQSMEDWNQDPANGTTIATNYRGGNAWLSPDRRFFHNQEHHYMLPDGVDYTAAMKAGFIRLRPETTPSDGSKTLWVEFYPPLAAQTRALIEDQAAERGMDDVHFDPDRSQTLAKASTRVDPGPDLFGFNTGLGLDTLLTPRQKEAKVQQSQQLDLFGAFTDEKPRTPSPRPARPARPSRPAEAPQQPAGFGELFASGMAGGEPGGRSPLGTQAGLSGGLGGSGTDAPSGNPTGNAGTDTAAGNEPAQSPDSRVPGMSGVGRAALIDRPGVGSPDRNFEVPAEVESLAPATDKAKILANLDAIRLLKQLEAERRNATPEEKKKLAAYTGWGAFKEAFNSKYEKDIADYWDSVPEYRRQYMPDWLKSWEKNHRPLHKMLRENMTEEEFASASASTLNAHYTAAPIIRAMWKMVERLGFKGGRALEPSAGAGHYLGLTPSSIADRTQWQTVELDDLSARLLSKLYPEATVNESQPDETRAVTGLGFERARIPNGSLDLIISNVPFHESGPRKKGFPALNLHNFFFAHALDKVKPGGLVAFITSESTMQNNLKQREFIASKGDLVAAFRLPNNAFKGNAGTEVTTDILIFRKPDGTPFKGQAWRNLVEVGRQTITLTQGKDQTLDELRREAERTGEIVGKEFWKDGKKAINVSAPILVNEYFVNHPQHALGTHTLASTMYRAGGYALVAPDGLDVPAALDALVPSLPENIVNNVTPVNQVERRLADRDDKPFSFKEQDGKIYEVQPDGSMEEAEWSTNPAMVKTWRSWKNLSQAIEELVAAETSDASDERLAALRRRLNVLYDTHTATHKPVSRRFSNAHKHLYSDPGYPLTAALENEIVTVDPKTGKKTYTYKKADIFTKRIGRPIVVPSTAQNVDDALEKSLAWKGHIDALYGSSLLGISPEAFTQQALQRPDIFANPDTGLLETGEEYLTGNVRVKLEAAEAAALDDPKYQRNVEALRAAQPERKEIARISPVLGARWIPAEVYGAFIKDVLQGSDTVEYIPAGNSWIISGSGLYKTEEHGTERKGPASLFKHALDMTEPMVYDGSGENRTFNATETAAAKTALDKMRRAFIDYVKTSDTPVVVEDVSLPVWEAVENAFNTTQNSYVTPRHVGQYLQFPGLNTDYVYTRAHRRAVIARFLSTRRGMMAHGVGSGKTFNQIILAQEMRRLGLAKKPVIVVQNSTLGQFAKSYLKAYPAAKILVPTKRDFEAQNRKKLVAKIATGNWDAVILPHSQFDLISNKPEAVKAYMDSQIDELMAIVTRTKDKAKVRDLEGMLKRLRDRRQDMLDKLAARQDTAVMWEDLGIDALIMDEAHNYKSLPIITRMGRVKGVPASSNSQRAINFMLKCRDVQSKTGGKNIFLATGTPIKNSMAEAYIMMQFMAPDVLEEFGIHNFDDFATTYGQTVTEAEMAWTGAPSMTTRFAKFQNGPSLVTLIRSMFDVAFGNEALGLDVPRVKGGEPEMLIVPATPIIQQFNAWTRSVDYGWKNADGKDKEEYTAVPIQTMAAGIAAAVDPRLISPGVEDHPQSKVNTAVRRVLDIYKAGTSKRTTQIIFSDLRNPFRMDYLMGFMHKAKAKADEMAAEGDPIPHAHPFPSATGGEFDLYKDIKAKLVAGGVPEKEVHLMQSGMTDVQKAALFEKVDNGEIRIIIGSTELLGVGVNIQTRLKAVHHLMPPRDFTPAMMEQRNGRIIRQGNLHAAKVEGQPAWNEEVVVVNYGTEGSMDSAIYGTLARKQRFITQLLMAEDVQDTFDDPTDPVAVNMAEMAARTLGDPDFIRRIELEKEIKDLRLQSDAFTNELSGKRSRLARLDSTIANRPKVIEELETTATRLASIWTRTAPAPENIKEGTDISDKPVYQFGGPPSNFPLQTIDTAAKDGAITNKLDLFLLDVSKTAERRGQTRMPVGLTINGHPLTLDVQWTLPGDTTPGEIQSTDGTRIAGFKGAASLIQNLRRAPADTAAQVERLRQDTEAARQQAEALRAKLATVGTFPDAAKLSALELESREVEERLRAKSSPPPSTPSTGSTESVKSPTLAKASTQVYTPTSYDTAPPDPFTGIPSLITGQRLLREQGRAIGHAHAQRLRAGLPNRPDSGNASPSLAASRAGTLNVSDAGTPARTLPTVPVLTPSQFSRLQNLPLIGEGAEAKVYADRERGTVYKVLQGYAPVPGVIGASALGVWPQVYYTADGRLDYAFAPTDRPRQLVVRLAVQTLVGGTPTEIVGIGPEGHIILKQPLSPAPEIGRDENFIDNSGLSIARNRAGLVEIPKALLADPQSPRVFLAVVEGRPWLLMDLHPDNFVGDNQAQGRINDAIVGQIPASLIAKVPGLAQLVKDAAARAQSLGDRSDRLFMASKSVRPSAAIELENQAWEAILQPHEQAGDQPSQTARVALVAASRLRPRDGSSNQGRDRMAAREFQADRERNTLQQGVTPWQPPAPSIGQRGEHIVHHDVPRQLMVKQTHGGRYGYTVDQGPDANQRRLTVRSAHPSEYLLRQGLMKVAFGDQLSVIAIVADPYHKSAPAIVIEQTHVKGTHDASEQNIADFMTAAGFTRLDDRLIDTRELPDGVWYRPSDHLLVADANPSNFVRLLNSEQIIPIDLVVTQYPPELIAEIEKLTSQKTTRLAKSSTTVNPANTAPSPLAKLGWNHLDRHLSAKLAALARWTDGRTGATQTVAKWTGAAPQKLRDAAHALQREFFPDSVLPREILAKKREMEIKTAMGSQRAMDLVRALSSNPKFSDIAYPPGFSENPAHRRQLYEAMTGERDLATLPKPLQDLAARLRAILVETGREAVKQGRMSTETFDNLRSTYMPHFYEEDVQKEKSLFQRFRLGVRDILAQRTTAWHIEDLSQKDSTGQPRLVSHSGNQWRFRNKEHMDAFFEDFIQQQALGELQSRYGKKYRGLTAVDLMTPSKLDPEVRGRLQEIKRTLHQRYKRQRPLTIAEQEKAGLIMDPVYAIARYAAQMAHDNSTAEFFNHVATQPSLVSDIATPGFTEIPDNPRFGRLAGKFVQDDVAGQLLELIEAPGIALKIYDTVLGWWKTGKTVLNPGTHVRNVLGNLFFSQLAGNSVWNPGNLAYYRQAIAALRQGGPVLTEAYDAGVLGADFVSAELRQTLRQLLPDPATIQEGTEKDRTAAAKLLLGIGKAMGRFIGTPAGKAYNNIAALYQAEDEVFKLAAYLKAKSIFASDPNLKPETLNSSAAQHVRKWFPYFDSGTSGTLRLLGRTAMPFLGFYRESIRIFGHALKERPIALAAGLAVPSIITFASAMALGLDDDDMEEIRKDMRGKAGKLLGPTPLEGMPLFSMLLPVRSESGQVQQFDISAVHPFVDFLGNRVESSNQEDWWQKTLRSFIAAGPIGSLLYSQMTGRDTFGDRPFVEANMTGGEKTLARLENVWMTAVPPLLGTGLRTLASAGERSTNKTLEERSPTQAVLRAVVGLDVRNATPDLYRLADDWRKANGYEVTEGMDYGSTTPASRARKALFAQLAQDEPNLTAISNILKSLDKMGHPVRTEQDINKLLFYRDPAKLIGGNKARGITPADAQAQFRASLQGEARQAFEKALQEFQRIKTKAPSLIRQAALTP